MATTQQKLYKVTKVKVRKSTPEKTCPHCYKKVAARGLDMHIKWAHSISKNESQVSQKWNGGYGGFTQNDVGKKIRIKKTGEIGIIVGMNPDGIELLTIEEIRSLYEKHCK
jgi:hypothetical protein